MRSQTLQTSCLRLFSWRTTRWTGGTYNIRGAKSKPDEGRCDRTGWLRHAQRHCIDFPADRNQKTGLRRPHDLAAWDPRIYLRLRCLVFKEREPPRPSPGLAFVAKKSRESRVTQGILPFHIAGVKKIRPRTIEVAGRAAHRPRRARVIHYIHAIHRPLVPSRPAGRDEMPGGPVRSVRPFSQNDLLKPISRRPSCRHSG